MNECVALKQTISVDDSIPVCMMDHWDEKFLSQLGDVECDKDYDEWQTLNHLHTEGQDFPGSHNNVLSSAV